MCWLAMDNIKSGLLFIYHSSCFLFPHVLRLPIHVPEVVPIFAEASFPGPRSLQHTNHPSFNHTHPILSNPQNLKSYEIPKISRTRKKTSTSCKTAFFVGIEHPLSLSLTVERDEIPQLRRNRPRQLQPGMLPKLPTSAPSAVSPYLWGQKGEKKDLLQTATSHKRNSKIVIISVCWVFAARKWVLQKNDRSYRHAAITIIHEFIARIRASWRKNRFLCVCSICVPKGLQLLVNPTKHLEGVTVRSSASIVRSNGQIIMTPEGKSSA